ncbi:DUF3464 family protein [Synechococcus sp. RSCCF101]|uniref:PAM68 family protein n=1 Tax=Synechococcus sp. RSCCF101 TaxID=2511069 RepID=UPI001244CCE2|nr:PAM68 family protein [Synechococcus sp. RSCCF101]QEY31495.1 DUF3464 family protein [Synechococcus sp. RSCCF101]
MGKGKGRARPKGGANKRQTAPKRSQADRPQPGGEPFAARATPPQKPARPAPARRSSPIPAQVSGRMARRVAVFTGVPSLLAMGVFVGSYLLVSRGGMEIPPALTLLVSGAFFLLGLVGLSYGVLSASWDTNAPGSLLGFEQLGVNLALLRASIRVRQAPAASGDQGVAEARAK